MVAYTMMTIWKYETKQENTFPQKTQERERGTSWRRGVVKEREREREREGHSMRVTEMKGGWEGQKERMDQRQKHTEKKLLLGRNRKNADRAKRGGETPLYILRWRRLVYIFCCVFLI